MCQVCINTINGIWGGIIVGSSYKTPDNSKGKLFQITDRGPDAISIFPQKISISIESFIKALEFLVHNGHNINNPIEIGSSNDPNEAGPLCKAARSANNNTRCINYILPILASSNYVGLDGKIPNKVWYM